MIGTHNSLTYLRPKYRWTKPLQIFCKCQNKTLAEQYACGVRWFDFEFALQGGKLVPAHGLMRYSEQQFITDLLALNALVIKSTTRMQRRHNSPPLVRIQFAGGGEWHEFIDKVRQHLTPLMTNLYIWCIFDNSGHYESEYHNHKNELHCYWWINNPMNSIAKKMMYILLPIPRIWSWWQNRKAYIVKDKITVIDFV